MRVLIVGCGYVGTRVGADLAQQGHKVFGLRRSRSADAELQAAGIRPLHGDLLQPPDLTNLPGPFDWVVNTVSSTRGGVEDYRAIYLQGARHLVAWLHGSTLRTFVYTSSTSVYGQEDGSWVDETSPAEPASATSRLLRQTENIFLDAARQGDFPAVLLRVAGIYGPDRGHLFQQYLRGELRLADQGQRVANMIHRDDVAGSVIAALERGRPAEIYNAADDEPVSHVDLVRWLARAMGGAMPALAPDLENAGPKRGLTNKRISNRKLKTELAYRFKFPTFREGYAAEIERLRQAGLLPRSQNC